MIRAALADRPEAVLRLERNTEFAHHDHIRRSAQFLSHLERYRHAATWQAEYGNIGAAQVPQPLGQVPPRVRAINEEHLATSARRTVLSATSSHCEPRHLGQWSQSPAMGFPVAPGGRKLIT